MSKIQSTIPVLQLVCNVLAVLFTSTSCVTGLVGAQLGHDKLVLPHELAYDAIDMAPVFVGMTNASMSVPVIDMDDGFTVLPLAFSDWHINAGLCMVFANAAQRNKVIESHAFSASAFYNHIVHDRLNTDTGAHQSSSYGMILQYEYLRSRVLGNSPLRFCQGPVIVLSLERGPWHDYRSSYPQRAQEVSDSTINLSPQGLHVLFGHRLGLQYSTQGRHFYRIELQSSIDMYRLDQSLFMRDPEHPNLFGLSNAFSLSTGNRAWFAWVQYSLHVNPFMVVLGNMNKTTLGSGLGFRL